MIANLSGKVIGKELNYLIIDIGGIGYKVYVCSNAITEAKMGSLLSLHTFLVVRENLLALYGFLKEEERELFELLISVSGIGPKGAIGILSQASPGKIKTSVVSGDYSILTNVSGIGKKTAERIVIELRNKVGQLDLPDKTIKLKGDSDREAQEALIALGFNQKDAMSALSKVDPKIKDVGDKVRQALRGMARR